MITYNICHHHSFLAKPSEIQHRSFSTAKIGCFLFLNHIHYWINMMSVMCKNVSWSDVSFDFTSTEHDWDVFKMTTVLQRTAKTELRLEWIMQRKSADAEFHLFRFKMCMHQDGIRSLCTANEPRTGICFVGGAWWWCRHIKDIHHVLFSDSDTTEARGLWGDIMEENKGKVWEAKRCRQRREKISTVE